MKSCFTVPAENSPAGKQNTSQDSRCQSKIRTRDMPNTKEFQLPRRSDNNTYMRSSTRLEVDAAICDVSNKLDGLYTM